MMRIYAGDADEPPLPMFIEVTCDRSHGLFAPPRATFPIHGEHPRTPAMRAGWKITADGEVLCPEHAR